MSFHSCYVQFHVCYNQSGCLIQVEITKKDKHRTATGWSWLLNKGGHLIRVT